MKKLLNQQVSWGIIGAGNVCDYKGGPPLYRVEGSVLTGVYRRDPEAGKSFVERHGHGEYFSSLDTLLADERIDAIYVASPHALHAEHTVACLRAGKHVLVEKPMAISTEETDRMLKAATESGCSLGVAYYRRGYPSVQRLANLLGEADFSRPLSCSVNNEFPTSHRLDLIHLLLGSAVKVRVFPAREDSFRFESVVERFDLETEGGCSVRMMTGWAESGMPEALDIRGEDWRLYLADLKGGRLMIQKGARILWEDTGSLPYTHTGLVDNFVRHLLQGDALLCTGEEGRKSTVILDALNAVDADGQWHEVVYP